MVNATQALSQAAIGRALDLSPASMTKLKKQGMPVDTVEAAQAWREARQNIAARKPAPVLDGPPSIPPPPDSGFGDGGAARTRNRQFQTKNILCHQRHLRDDGDNGAS